MSIWTPPKHIAKPSTCGRCGGLRREWVKEHRRHAGFSYHRICCCNREVSSCLAGGQCCFSSNSRVALSWTIHNAQNPQSLCQCEDPIWLSNSVVLPWLLCYSSRASWGHPSATPKPPAFDGDCTGEEYPNITIGVSFTASAGWRVVLSPTGGGLVLFADIGGSGLPGGCTGTTRVSEPLFRHNDGNHHFSNCGNNDGSVTMDVTITVLDNNVCKSAPFTCVDGAQLDEGGCG